MNDNDIKEVLSKALKISKSNFYTVKFFRPNKSMYKQKRMSYLELGMFLTYNTDTIENVEIHMRE